MHCHGKNMSLIWAKRQYIFAFVRLLLLAICESPRLPNWITRLFGSGANFSIMRRSVNNQSDIKRQTRYAIQFKLFNFNENSHECIAFGSAFRRRPTLLISFSFNFAFAKKKKNNIILLNSTLYYLLK